jgi:alcohol dehydrogenase class IV
MRFHAPREILLEIGILAKIPEVLRNLGIAVGDNVLVVIDPVVMNQEYFKSAERSMREAGYEIELYTDIEYEPSVDCARRLATHARKTSPKAVVGIGGGSTLDLAKVAAISVDNPSKDVEEFIGFDKVPRRITPLILSPSTSGTGSEATRHIVLTKGSAKTGIASRCLLPDVALIDPVLTYTMPPRLTAGAGLDALSHAVEAMISADSNPITDLLALQAIHLVFGYLRRAYLNGRDVEARYFMSLAATAAGMSFSSAKVLLGHNISQTFGPRYKVHHGIACGMALPYIMEFYLPATPEKFAAMADAIGVGAGARGIYEKAEGAIMEVWRLLEGLEIPLSLKEIGVSKSDLDELAERSVKDWPRPNSPVELTKDRVLKVYESMYDGRLKMGAK